LNQRAYGAVKDAALEGYDLAKTHGPKVLKTAGKVAGAAAVPVLTAVDANSNLDQNAEFYRDPNVSGLDKFTQRMRDVGQPIIQNGLAGAGAFVGSGAATPFVGGVVGGSLGYGLGGAINAVIDDEGEALRNWKASYVPNKGVLDANAARNADRVQNKATANPDVKVPNGYIDPVMRDALAKADARQKQMNEAYAYDTEAGLRGNLAMLSFAQMGGNQQAGFALKNLMDQDATKLNAHVGLVKAAASGKADGGLSMGDIEKLITNTYGEQMLQPIMQGAEQLRHIDVERARASGNEVLARELAGAKLDQSYITRAAQAASLQAMPSSGEEAALGTAGGAGLGALLGGAITGIKSGVTDGVKTGLKRGIPGAVGGALLGGLVGGANGWFGGTNHAPAELGIDPYRSARIEGDQVVFYSGNVPVGNGPLSDVPKQFLPQLHAQSN
jgi:hypothetical protein